jgi:DNA invertase Pin-like site-specific DNA recombinase
MKAILYARVSTTDQSHDLQLKELVEYCKRRGWEIVGTYKDTMSGAKDRRPGLDALMADARRRKFDAVVCWKFDRFARSTSHLLRALEEFAVLNVNFVSVTEAIDTSTPAGELVFTVLGAVAELERCLIRERCAAGRKAAKVRGVRFGRPSVEVNVVRVHRLRNEGFSLRAIAARVGVSHETVAKFVR